MQALIAAQANVPWADPTRQAPHVPYSWGQAARLILPPMGSWTRAKPYRVMMEVDPAKKSAGLSVAEAHELLLLYSVLPAGKGRVTKDRAAIKLVRKLSFLHLWQYAVVMTLN